MYTQIEIRRIPPLSLARVLGTLQAFFGLLVAVVGTAIVLFAPAPDPENWMWARQEHLLRGFGASSLLTLPIGFAIAGFLAGLSFALAYNYLASLTNGLEVEAQIPALNSFIARAPDPEPRRP